MFSQIREHRLFHASLHSGMYYLKIILEPKLHGLRNTSHTGKYCQSLLTLLPDNLLCFLYSVCRTKIKILTPKITWHMFIACRSAGVLFLLHIKESGKQAIARVATVYMSTFFLTKDPKQAQYHSLWTELAVEGNIGLLGSGPADSSHLSPFAQVSVGEWQ